MTAIAANESKNNTTRSEEHKDEEKAAAAAADDDEEGCFLSRLMQQSQVEDEEDCDTTTTETTANAQTTNAHPTQYVDKKPKWWRRQAGRRGTRAQRAALARMSALGYCIERTKNEQGQLVHGVEIDLFNAFRERPRRLQGSSNKPTAVAAEEENASKEIWLEIGFGQGENLLTCAKMHPERCYVGADVHQPGACTVLGRVEASVKAGTYWNGATLYERETKATSDINTFAKVNDTSINMTNVPYDNVRIYCGDGIKLLQSIPLQSLSAIVLPFPDPWPNTTSHSKWRVIQPDTLRCFERVLKPNGLFYLATDAESFDEWCRDIFDTHGQERGWEEVTPCPDRTDWLPAISKYEEKGMNEGRSTMLQCWKFVDPKCFQAALS